MLSLSTREVEKELESLLCYVGSQQEFPTSDMPSKIESDCEPLIICCTGSEKIKCSMLKLPMLGSPPQVIVKAVVLGHTEVGKRHGTCDWHPSRSSRQ
jgi:hypothetical protein